LTAATAREPLRLFGLVTLVLCMAALVIDGLDYQLLA
jgi:hypothetical protein